VGVGYALGNFNLLLKWVDNDADFTERGDAFNNEGRVIFSISTTFPWEKGS